MRQKPTSRIYKPAAFQRARIGAAAPLCPNEKPMILILDCVRVPGVTHIRKHNHICIHSYTHTHTHVTYKHRCTHAHIHTPTFTLRPDADSHKFCQGQTLFMRAPGPVVKPSTILLHGKVFPCGKSKRHDFTNRKLLIEGGLVLPSPGPARKSLRPLGAESSAKSGI